MRPGYPNPNMEPQAASYPPYPGVGPAGGVTGAAKAPVAAAPASPQKPKQPKKQVQATAPQPKPGSASTPTEEGDAELVEA